MVCFTTNGWTSYAQQSYAAFTAYFLDENWTLHSFVLIASEFPGSHTAEGVKTKFVDLSISLSLSLTHTHFISLPLSLSFFQPD